MRLIKKTMTVIYASLLVVVWSSPSEAFQRGHLRGRYGNGHTHYSKHGRYGHAHRHYSKHGRSPKHHLRHKHRHYGRKYRYKHRGHHHRGRLGYRHYGLGFHLGQGYYKYRHYRYPYRRSYNYRNRSYKTYGYPKSYEHKSYDTGDSYEEYEAGWNLLRKGRPAEAADAFGRLARANPNEGMPKIGYALAAAELGRLDKGVWAMRRALRTDPESLHYVTVDQLMQPKVEAVIQQYEQSYSNSDGFFMVAALLYLLGDVDAAHQAMERDNHNLETSTSAENLRVLIEQETPMRDN